MKDNELDKVNGGGVNFYGYPLYAKPSDVIFHFSIGQQVEVVVNVGFLTGHVYTKRHTIVRKGYGTDEKTGLTIPCYILEDGHGIAEYQIEGVCGVEFCSNL